MTLELWLAFTFASLALLLIPGPTILLTVNYALHHGKSSGWATVPGVALGDLTAMSLSLLGAGAILAASATLFSLLKLAGAAYLIWLGFKLWRSRPHLEDMPESMDSMSSKKATKWQMFMNAYIVTALNPKGIVFFVAFVPQFINLHADLLPQMIILIATFVSMAALNIAAWSFLTGFLRERFKRPATLRVISKTGAAFLIGGGLFTALLGRANS